VFPHNDAAGLRALLAADAAPGVRFVVVESLFSMDGDLAPLAEYASICRDARAALIVDEAHAVGVYGRRGSGLIEACGVEASVSTSINTAGKALGLAGAFVAGPTWMVEALVQCARPFVFSTAAPPALAHALDESLTVVADEPERRERVLGLAAHLRLRLAEAGVMVPPGTTQIVPVLVGGNDRALAIASALQRDGFDVRAIRPPSVREGTARLRISVNAGLDEVVIDRFADALARALREAGVCCEASS
jgi:8-amino-7-oxononanoate synthase